MLASGLSIDDTGNDDRTRLDGPEMTLMLEIARPTDGQKAHQLPYKSAVGLK